MEETGSTSTASNTGKAGRDENGNSNQDVWAALVIILALVAMSVWFVADA